MKENELRDVTDKMHLQWFADAADVEDDVDEGVEEEYEFVDDEFLPDEDAADGGDDDEAASAKDREREERIEQLRSRLEGDGVETRTAMQEIAETMKELRKQPQSEQKQDALEDLNALKKRIANGFYDDPVAAMEQYYEARMKKYERETLQPVFQQMGQVLRETAKSASKQSITSETDKYVLDNYYDEVEKLVESGQIQIGPNAYKEAIGRVAANHMSEIIAEQVKQQISAQQVEPEAPKTPGRNASPSGANAAPRPSGRPQVSAHALRVLQQRAKAKSINEKQYIDWFVANKKDELRKLNRGEK